MKVGVFVSHFSQYDAMCNDALEMYRTLLRLGIDAQFFASHVADRRDDVEMRILRDSDDFLQNPDNLLIFHHGIYEPVFSKVVDAKCRKVLRYHNITESRFFRGYDSVAEDICHKGRYQLKGNLDAFEYYWSNSRYSSSELVEKFDGDPRRCRVLFPFHFVEDRFPNQQTQIDVENFRVLTVGRVAPHKNQLVLVRGFFEFCDHLTQKEAAEVRLIVVGKIGPSRYWGEIEAAVASSPHGKLVEFHSNGITESMLAGFYRSAAAFFLPSMHEGFCVPVVEAMNFGLPIVSSNEGALRDTVACYGLRLNSTSEVAISEAMRRLYSSRFLRQDLGRLAKSGFRDYASDRIHRRFEELFLEFSNLDCCSENAFCPEGSLV